MKKTIGIIGCGNMGAAILAGIHRKYNVCIAEKDKKRTQAVKRKFKVKVAETGVLIRSSHVVILAVKPQNFAELLAGIRTMVRKDQLIISIAAGISTKFIEKALGENVKVVRAMPNLPSQIGEGITAIARGKNSKPEDMKYAGSIFDLIGDTVIVEEKMIDSVTAVSGSGPAYLFYFVECLEQAARASGLNQDISRRLVRKTLMGSLKLLETQNIEVAVLRKQVTSKGGTTQAALKVLNDNKINLIIKSALLAAKKRAKELSR